MEGLEQATADKDRLALWIAFDYGGRRELVDAARSLLGNGVSPEQIDEERLAAALYAPEMPDPDIVIRTSGELRLSNFLLWQSAYSELYFTERLWPDFGHADLEEAITAYTQRRRRFGGR
jgi:undecaprenyl diphosphate synthase